MISARPTRPEIGARTCGERQVERGGIHRRFGRLQIGGGLLVARGARVELFLRDRALLDQPVGALALGLRQRQLRARARQFGLRMLERGLVGTRVDDIQDVALLHLVTLFELRGRHVARDARTDFDSFNGLEAAGEFVELGDRLRDDLGGLNRRRRGRQLSAASLRAQAAEDHGDEES